MKRFTIATLALAFAAASCSDKSPTAPSANMAIFTADLKASNEVPPISNAENTGSGFATITLNLTRDSANNVTAATADFVATFTGFPAGTPINLSHIHNGPAGVNAGVVVNTGLTGAAPETLANGSGFFIRNGITVMPALAQQIVNNPAGFYFNSHTTLNPGGAVRGQLVRVQ